MWRAYLGAGVGRAPIAGEDEDEPEAAVGGRGDDLVQGGQRHIIVHVCGGEGGRDWRGREEKLLLFPRWGPERGRSQGRAAGALRRSRGNCSCVGAWRPTFLHLHRQLGGNASGEDAQDGEV